MSDADKIARYDWMVDNITYFETRGFNALYRNNWSSDHYAPHIYDMIDYMRGVSKPKPCTDEAFYLGCSCSWTLAEPTAEDRLKTVIDDSCPVHGRQERED